MNRIMNRRRSILQKDNTLIPNGYVKDGLIFFLDCKQLCTEYEWQDIVGNVVFTMHNTEIAADGGVVFDGAAYGEQENAVAPYEPDDPNYTYEIVTDGLVSNQTARVFEQDANFGECFAIMKDAIFISGYNKRKPIPPATKIASAYYADGAYFVVADKIESTAAEKNKLSFYTPGDNTIVGGRFIEDELDFPFIGKIYALRIYNRALSKAEMISNQKTDVTRYGITLE